MAGEPVVHIGENSPEQVAWRMTDVLLRIIEKKELGKITRKEFLDTYSECLEAVKGFRTKPKQWQSETGQ